ncbi:hypothetical protein ACIQ1D_18960 [Lysinibacillus xylanilyticus]|uniref:hypothetical protein n=1 Tax=Lysinibacillus xylanilyticus TaxID=582475 RepID=UPI0037FF5397
MIYSIGDVIKDISEFHWQSDWNGDEVGFPEIETVGLYTDFINCYTYYIDMDSLRILEVFNDREEEE